MAVLDPVHMAAKQDGSLPRSRKDGNEVSRIAAKRAACLVFPYGKAQGFQFPF